MRAIGLLTIVGLASAALGQAPPIADRVDQPILPSGITQFNITLDAQLVTLFTDPDGIPALHLTGQPVIQIGEPPSTELRADQALVWVHDREQEGRAYRHLQMFLWREAEVTEVGGTQTTSPLLFVTTSTFGQVRTRADDIARAPFADPTATEIYQQGNAIRQALTTIDTGLTDAEAAMTVFDPANEGRRDTEAVRPVLYFQSPGKLTLEKIGERQVMTIVGGVYMARGTPEADRYLEIQADHAVIFFLPGQEATLPGLAQGPDEAGSTPPDSATEGPLPRQADRRRTDSQFMATNLGEVEVEGAYLEGDIRMRQGPHSVRASRLYYDFRDERALILDAVARTMIRSRDLPLHLRAAEIRQLSNSRYVAQDAILTVSEFHTPHYHIGAERVELRTQPGAIAGIAEGSVRGGEFDIRNATLNIYGHPIAYWPHVRGTLDTSETAIRSVRTGYSGDFGFEAEIDWHLFNLLGYETPKGFDATLSTGIYTDRGPFAGVEVDYLRDRYFGAIRSFALYDEDEDSLGEEREKPPEQDFRGRLLWRHRHYLEDDWQLSLELSYISDKTFLEEYFETEYDTSKEQETLLYAKKQRDNWAFTVLLQTRILDFLTQTERLPDFAYFLLGEPVGDRATWFSENRAGLVRYRVGDRTLRDFLREGKKESSDTTVRADTRQEIDAPIGLGPWRLVPFGTVRGTTWSDSPDDGGLSRGFGAVGVRGSTYLSRTFPAVESSLWDINGLRHIIKPDFAAWVSEANHSADDLFPFDASVEGIDAVDGVMIGLRQRLQTKRGPEAARRIVDVLTHDLEVGVFNGSDAEPDTNGFTSFSRPENSVARNHVRSSLIWRINDRTAVLNEINYDMDDGHVDIANVSLAVERTPRFSYLIGYRFIDETDSNLLGLDMNYRMTEKHTLALRELFDLERGRTLDFTVGLIRKFPRWFGALSFELDEAEDDFGVSVSMWPEGLPQAALGSRRFTGLAGTTLYETD